MTLRNRLVLAIASVNAVILCALALFATVDAREREREEGRKRERGLEQTVTILSNIVDALATQGRQEDLVRRLLSLRAWQSLDDPTIWSPSRDAAKEDIFLNPRGRKASGHRPDGAALRSFILEAMEKEQPIRHGEAVAAPIILGSGDSKVKWGGVYYRIPSAPSQAIRPLVSVPNIVAMMAAATLVVSFLMFAFLSRSILRPLQELTAASERVARGDYGQAIPVRGRDEMAESVLAFNTMMREVGDLRHHMEARIAEATEQIRRAERHLVTAQRLAATGQLAAGIAHEINNPLGGMMNVVRNLVNREYPPEKRKEYLAILEDGLRRIQETVKKVLSFTPRKVSPQAFDLRAALDRAIALVQHRIDKERVLFSKSLPPEPVSVFGDSSELQQVFLNLLINALDALKGVPRPPRLDLALSTTADEAVVAIEDNGCGMDPEHAERAFDLFFTTKDPGEGTGLGLAIVHNIVTAHGGRVDLRSRPGEGTRFETRFPRVNGT